jgi:F-box protein 8
MGQVSSCSGHQQLRSHGNKPLKLESFPDLVTLPPELAVQVLSHLDATDLCLAACVNEGWCSLANVELLWKG